MRNMRNKWIILKDGKYFGILYTKAQTEHDAVKAWYDAKKAAGIPVIKGTYTAQKAQ